ncbi:DNA-directed RNA polymerase, mitochondrial-like [Trichoplusia ni]|nr:DNA-directed RNA polymerase, mitochondrial-like [Trichoplusia ni]
MTTVYGVTKFGARLQIAKQLKDIDDFPKEHVWSCSQYLTAKTFDSLREMFTSTKLIQDWFTDCAKLISAVCGESVEWVTPLGLPVVQPYYRRAGTAQPHRPPLDQQQRPCTMKQRNAFPPNFIHSLDSSHMMLTALHCEAAGLTFVSVHDCFWTHPNTVDLMNKICREQFVALHSQPILEDLSAFLVNRYSYDESELEDRSIGAANKKRVNSLLQKVPSKGDFDLTSVLKSVYFFS